MLYLIHFQFHLIKKKKKNRLFPPEISSFLFNRRHAGLEWHKGKQNENNLDFRVNYPFNFKIRFLGEKKYGMLSLTSAENDKHCKENVSHDSDFQSHLVRCMWQSLIHMF